MSEVGAYEAKIHFSELLDRVARGERITITRYGTPVAVLSPPDPCLARGRAGTLAEIRAFRKGRRMQDEEIRSLVEEGRR